MVRLLVLMATVAALVSSSANAAPPDHSLFEAHAACVKNRLPPPQRCAKSADGVPVCKPDQSAPPAWSTTGCEEIEKKWKAVNQPTCDQQTDRKCQ